jgi:phospholipid transport system substrate-binding protein
MTPRDADAQRRVPRHLPARRVWLALPLVLVGLLLPGFVQAADAPPAKSAVDVIRETVEEAFKILRDESLKKDAALRMRKLREVVDRTFDWEAMAQSSIGPQWRKLDDKQRSEFVRVFKELLAQQYMDDIDRFQGSEKVTVNGSEKRGELELVKTTLITASREQVPIDYTLHKTTDAWRVEDVSVEGVSLVNHYRTTFSRFLVNKSFDELLQQLKRKLGLS